MGVGVAGVAGGSLVTCGVEAVGGGITSFGPPLWTLTGLPSQQ